MHDHEMVETRSRAAARKAPRPFQITTSRPQMIMRPRANTGKTHWGKGATQTGAVRGEASRAGEWLPTVTDGLP